MRTTVSSPTRAALTVSLGMPDTRCALSAIWREVTSNSLMVVAISRIAVAGSRALASCWFEEAVRRFRWSQMRTMCTTIYATGVAAMAIALALKLARLRVVSEPSCVFGSAPDDTGTPGSGPRPALILAELSRLAVTTLAAGQHSQV